MPRPAVTYPPSPALIDFTVYQPRQTLLDRQDTYGFPSPRTVLSPYRDNFTDNESDEDARSEGQKEVEKLLQVPRPRRRVSIVAPPSREVKEKGTKSGGDGCFSITLPDGSSISFRPPTSATAGKGPSAGPVSLGNPVIAQGFEEAFEAIKKLAIGNGARQDQAKDIPAPVKKAVEAKKRRTLPPPNPPLVAEATKSPWPILPPGPQASKLAPTAPSFQPRQPPKSKGYTRPPAPPSPSTSPSPPLSNYTDNPPLISSSRTSSPDRYPTIVIESPGAGTGDSRPVVITSPSRLQSLFETDIQAIPWTRVNDFPYTQKPKKKKRTAAPGEEQAHIPQTAAEINKKVDDILRSFGGALEASEAHSAPRKSIDEELLGALSKVRATKREALASKRIVPVAGWNPSATAFQPKASSKLVDIESTPLVNKYKYIPVEPTLTIYDPPSPPKPTLTIYDPPTPAPFADTTLYKPVSTMNGVTTYDWQGGQGQGAQDINSYFDERDRLEARTLRTRIDPVPTAKLVDVSEFAQTITKARTKVVPAALPSTPYDRLLSLPSARASVPRALCTSGDSLQISLMRSWISAEPTDEQKQYVKNLAALLTRLVDNEWGRGAGARDQRFTVDVFGSVSWGGETGRGGDVDMVIRDSFYPQGYHPALWSTEEEEPQPRQRGRNPNNVFRVDLSPVYDLHNVVYLLKRKGFAEVFGIYGATTPIAKFKDPTRPGVEADVNVNDLGGWYNSRLILAYCEISPHVLRPLIHCLKLWAKVNHVNDPSGKYGMPTMSSYCLTLMAIAYLQHEGVLPNLQADVEVRVPDYPETEGKDVIWAGWGKSTGTKINVGFAEQPKEGWRSAQPTLTAAEAVRGFFAHFARTGSGKAFQYGTQVISILNGGVIDRAKTQSQETQEAQARRAAGIPAPTREEMCARETMMGKGDLGIQPRNWSERKLVVQDPFIWQKNCTQSMSKQGLDRWMNAVDGTHRSLVMHRDKCSLETLLANCLSLPPLQAPRHPYGGESRAARDQMYRSNGGGGGGGGNAGGQMYRSSGVGGGTGASEPPQMYRSGGGGGSGGGFGQRVLQPTRVSPYGRTLFSPR